MSGQEIRTTKKKNEKRRKIKKSLVNSNTYKTPTFTKSEIEEFLNSTCFLIEPDDRIFIIKNPSIRLQPYWPANTVNYYCPEKSTSLTQIVPKISLKLCFSFPCMSNFLTFWRKVRKLLILRKEKHNIQQTCKVHQPKLLMFKLVLAIL